MLWQLLVMIEKLHICNTRYIDFFFLLMCR